MNLQEQISRIQSMMGILLENDPKIEKSIDEPTTDEENKEMELTEKCWKGYTQKGMKTMFGKRYPNCVKKTKK
jgi:hypothetical protein